MNIVRREKIVCPNCQAVRDAEVHFEDWMPFPAYVHTCSCGYTIMESEWERVEKVTVNRHHRLRCTSHRGRIAIKRMNRRLNVAFPGRYGRDRQ